MRNQLRKIEFGDFQTPLSLAQEVCSLLKRRGISPCDIIEPTCGEGSFLEAAASVFGENPVYFGFDINAAYISTAQRRLKRLYPRLNIQFCAQDFFTFDWVGFLRSLDGPILFLGNPPWVTNATLGMLDAGNLPKKSNIKRLDGLDARTGKANFDISEWMLLKLIEAAGLRDCTIAMLCKTGVARKVLDNHWRHSRSLSDGSVYRIDAAKWFDAAVSACLFVGKLPWMRSEEQYACFYESLQSDTATSRFGMVDGQIVSDVDAYLPLRHLSGVNYYRWRSGVKHVLAKVMELRSEDGRLRNGFGEEVNIEEDILYPLLKAGDIAKGVTIPARYVLITQTAVGGDTGQLRSLFPRAWHYLEQHKPLFVQRKSSIYRGQPDYRLFGIGEYSFAPYKVAISGLHKEINFAKVSPYRGKPIFVDDTCYFVGSENEAEADLLQELLNSDIVRSYLQSGIFEDNKRPITAETLNRLDIKKVAEAMGRAEALEGCLSRGNIESGGQGLLVFEAQERNVSPNML